MGRAVGGVEGVQNYAGGRLTIDLQALVENFLRIKAHVSPASLAAVVKADAYG